MTPEKIDYSLCHEIHTSERRSFKGCKLRWNWHFRGEWTPKGAAPPLEFGIAYHRGMEVLYEPETWHWDKEIVGQLAIKAFVDNCNQQRAEHLAQSDCESLEAAVQEEFDERVKLGRGMLEYYFRRQLPKYPEKFKVVKVEIAFKVPIMHPDTGEQLFCKCNNCFKRYMARQQEEGVTPADMSSKDTIFWKGLPVVYAGRLDALLEDENGDYWIIDWKTARSISTDDTFLELDDQISSYVWALRLGLKLPVKGFIYHEQRKGFPEPPQRLKVIRKGCSFSVSKSQTTDYETFLRTVETQDSAAYRAGYYDEFLEYLKAEGILFFKRWQIVRTDDQLKMIGYDIGQEALDMIDSKTRIYPSPGKFGCQFCAFRQPCLGRRAGEDVEFLLKTLFTQEEPYYYRQARGASTESKGGE